MFAIQARIIAEDWVCLTTVVRKGQLIFFLPVKLLDEESRMELVREKQQRYILHKYSIFVRTPR